MRRWLVPAMCVDLLFGRRVAPSASVLEQFHWRFSSPTHGAQIHFATAGADSVWRGSFQGWTDATPTEVMSVSKLITSFAVMRTMQLRPADWHPDKFVNDFKVGRWSTFGNLALAGSKKRFNVTIGQLLMHTSGFPMTLTAVCLDVVRMQGLCFEPGTGWSYSIGHRLLGWLLRDYWHKPSVQAAFDELVYKPLGMSSTHFANWFTPFFFMAEAGDGGITSTAADLRRFAVAVLRKGRASDGRILIDEANWDAWAMRNLLPGGARIADFRPTWRCLPWVPAGLGIGATQAGQSLFAGTFGGGDGGEAAEVGWAGLFNSALHVSYAEDLAFVQTQRKIQNPFEALFKKVCKIDDYYVRHFRHLAKYLQCKPVRCAEPGEVARLCSDNGTECQDSVTYTWLSPGAALHVSERSRACYLPRCRRGQS